MVGILRRLSNFASRDADGPEYQRADATTAAPGVTPVTLIQLTRLLAAASHQSRHASDASIPDQSDAAMAYVATSEFAGSLPNRSRIQTGESLVQPRGFFRTLLRSRR